MQYNNSMDFLGKDNYFEEVFHTIGIKNGF